MPSYKCLRDCHDGKEQLYRMGELYEIDPLHPCAVHFDLPPTLRKQALEAERKRREKAGIAQEQRAIAKAQGISLADLAMMAAEESVATSPDTGNKAAPTAPGPAD